MTAAPAVGSPFWGKLEKIVMQEQLEAMTMALAILCLVGFFSDTLLDFFRLIQNLGLPFDVALTLLGLQMPKVLALVLPASAFLAVLLVFNRKNNHFELIALRTSGVSLMRLLRAPLVLGLLVAALTYILGDWIVPYCNQQADALKLAMISEGGLPLNADSFVFKDYDNEHRLQRLVFVGHIERGQLHDATIMDLSRLGMLQVVQAKAGRWFPNRWVFEQANAYTVSMQKKLLVSNHLESMTMTRLLDVAAEKQDDLAAENPSLKEGGLATGGTIIVDSDTQPFYQLWQSIAQRAAAGQRVAKKSYIKLWERLTMPLATLVMLAMAVPLAMHAPRRGAERGFIFAMAVLFLFYMTRAVAVAIGQSKVLTLGGVLDLPTSLAIAAWLPIGLMTIAAISLIRWKNRVL
ncbi:MAG: LptF/LptG family permease [Vampirovibrionales bacterium]|nr:LptF/LptG family permease [Vampirovibrionales bacterium]